jgi:hypothetical protein
MIYATDCTMPEVPTECVRVKRYIYCASSILCLIILYLWYLCGGWNDFYYNIYVLILFMLARNLSVFSSYIP